MFYKALAEFCQDSAVFCRTFIVFYKIFVEFYGTLVEHYQPFVVFYQTFVEHNYTLVEYNRTLAVSYETLAEQRFPAISPYNSGKCFLKKLPQAFSLLPEFPVFRAGKVLHPLPLGEYPLNAPDKLRF
jgi:hypothetical protein